MVRFSIGKLAVLIVVVVLTVYYLNASFFLETRIRTRREFLTKLEDKSLVKISLVETATTSRNPRPNRDLMENLTRPFYNRAKDKGFGPSGKYFALRKSKITDIPKDFFIDGSTICRGETLDILFVVPSVANTSTAKNRRDIRKTWASAFYGEDWLQTSNMRLAFFFGSSGLNAEELENLMDESSTYGDIVVGGFNDTYHNLSVKMAVTLSWVARFCHTVNAVVKIDMDTFVNVKLLLNLLQKLPSATHPNFVYGHLHVADHPPALREGAWAVPESVYPYDEFPRYVLGHSYVVSGPAVRLMAESFPYFPIVPNEDAFITGVMPVVLNITRFYHTAFASHEWGHGQTMCTLVHHKHVSLLIKSEERSQLWEYLNTGQCV